MEVGLTGSLRCRSWSVSLFERQIDVEPWHALLLNRRRRTDCIFHCMVSAVTRGWQLIKALLTASYCQRSLFLTLSSRSLFGSFCEAWTSGMPRGLTVTFRTVGLQISLCHGRIRSRQTKFGRSDRGKRLCLMPRYLIGQPPNGRTKWRLSQGINSFH